MISTVTNAHAQQEILLLAMKAGQIQLENGAEHRFLPCLLRFFTNPGRMGQLSPAIK